jgi:hypothetical protein
VLKFVPALGWTIVIPNDGIRTKYLIKDMVNWITDLSFSCFPRNTRLEFEDAATIHSRKIEPILQCSSRQIVYTSFHAQAFRFPPQVYDGLVRNVP